MGPEPSSSSSASTTTTTTTKGVALRLVQHHHAVVGFLFGFSLVLLLYTTVSGQFGSRDAIVVRQSTEPVHDDHRDRPSPTKTLHNNSSPPLPQGSKAEIIEEAPEEPSDFPEHTWQGNNTKQENQQLKDTTGKLDEELIQDNIDDVKPDGLPRITPGQASQPMNNITEKMKDEISRHEIDEAGKKNEKNIKHGVPSNPICDLSDPRFDLCEMYGDARTLGINRTVFDVLPVEELGFDSQEWRIRDQSRKYLDPINKVTVKSVNASRCAPDCTSRHAVPAIVFAVNGLTSNPWHGFSDVLIPLFITARPFDGEVQFLVSDLEPWFIDKYRLILKNLSRYDIVDFNRDDLVRCYPHVIVGLRSHRDLGIDPARAPRNYTLLDFRMYIRDIYSLPANANIPYKVDTKPDKKPRLMLINRQRTRKFVNFPEIAAAIRDAGFDVLPIEPHRDLKIEEFSLLVDSCDVLMGAHGAGLTNFFFLRTNTVMLQVVPWGHMEGSSMWFYGGPAREMRLQDIEYSITAEESTLYGKYGKDHPVISDPDSIHKQGWQLGMKYYWLEQDIRLNMTRFAPTLQQVLRMIME